jgi:polar amino acid transport system substrate-binding protein
MRTAAVAAAGLLLATGLTACGVAKTDTTASACKVGNIPTLTKGTLTVATDSPAYDPWFSNNTPSNGKGFESAVAYAIGQKLGFAPANVKWVKEAFNNSYAPGPKTFDFDVNQISITPERATAVDFSTSYYSTTQALIVMKSNAAAHDTSLSQLKKLHLGAQTATTSLTAIRNDVQPTQTPAVFGTNDAAVQALKNGQVDGIVVDLWTALYLQSSEIPNSVIVGQFKASGSGDQFGALLQKGNPLTQCVNNALAAMKADGTLKQITDKWVSPDQNKVPYLK